MTQIQVKIENAQACAAKTGELTAGMVGLPVSFVFGPEWDGLSITAVFQGSGQIKDQLLLSGTETTVPHEVMTAAGSMLRIGAEGRNSAGDLVIPSTMATVGIIQPGADPSGDVSTDPTLTVWQQIIGLIGNMEDLAAEDAKTLVEAINAAAKSGVGAVIYVQPDEPEGAPVGALWLDTDDDDMSSAHNGATFIPTVSEDGLLSWSNDKGLDNPEPVNIRGADGQTPYIGSNGNWWIGAADTGVNAGGASAEAIQEAVNAYLEENPAEPGNCVKTVNGVTPDENGDVAIEVSGGETVIVDFTVEEEVTELTIPIDASFNEVFAGAKDIFFKVSLLVPTTAAEDSYGQLTAIQFFYDSLGNKAQSTIYLKSTSCIPKANVSWQDSCSVYVVISPIIQGWYTEKGTTVAFANTTPTYSATHCIAGIPLGYGSGLTLTATTGIAAGSRIQLIVRR